MKNGVVKSVVRKIVKMAVVAVMVITVFVSGFVTSEVLRDVEQQTVVSGTGNSLQGEQTINKGISLMAANGTDYVGNTLGQSAPYGALQVTATVTPSSASNQKLTWTFAWAGTMSSWSSGKNVNDYFNLQSNGTNAHEIYIWATQPFGDQVKVTATTTDGTNKTATMTVDFAKRMTGVTGLTGLNGTFNYTTNTFEPYFYLDGLRYDETRIEYVEVTPTYSAGSKSLTWELVDFTIAFDDGLTQELTATLGKQCRTEWSYSGGDGSDSYIFNMWTYDIACELFAGTNAEANYNTLVDCIVDNGRKLGYLYLDFESVETDSLGKKYTYTASFEALVSSSSLGLIVENVALSDSALTL